MECVVFIFQIDIISWPRREKRKLDTPSHAIILSASPLHRRFNSALGTQRRGFFQDSHPCDKEHGSGGDKETLVWDRRATATETLRHRHLNTSKFRNQRSILYRSTSSIRRSN